VPVTIKITSVYGIKDNGELVNIVVEGNSDEIPYILITIWGKKQNRNIIRQISSGSFNESIEQEIINSAQCKCGEQIAVRAYCLENSAISDVWKGELQCFEIGKEAAAPIAEGEETKELIEIAEEEGEEKAGFPESLSLEMAAPEVEEEVTASVIEDQEAEEAEEDEEAKELIEIEEEKEEEEKSGLAESLSLEIPAPEKEEEESLSVAEGQEAEEAEEGEKAKELIEIEEEKEEEEKSGLTESLSLEIPAPEKEEKVTVPAAESQEAEELDGVEESEEAVEVAEVKDEEEEKISPPESLPLETPASDKEEAAIVVAERLETKGNKESVPKLFLFPNIEIKTVKGFTYNGNLVDIIVEGTSTEDKRILIKIQWGNSKYYKIVNPSSSGEFKTSFEQDISRSAQSEGGDQITVTALSLANSAIFDIWQEKICCVEKVEETSNTISGSNGVEGDTEGMETDHEK
jgi:hypothetical protein